MTKTLSYSGIVRHEICQVKATHITLDHRPRVYVLLKPDKSHVTQSQRMTTFLSHSFHYSSINKLWNELTISVDNDPKENLLGLTLTKLHDSCLREITKWFCMTSVNDFLLISVNPRAHSIPSLLDLTLNIWPHLIHVYSKISRHSIHYVQWDGSFSVQLSILESNYL